MARPTQGETGPFVDLTRFDLGCRAAQRHGPCCRTLDVSGQVASQQWLQPGGSAGRRVLLGRAASSVPHVRYVGLFASSVKGQSLQLHKTGQKWQKKTMMDQNDVVTLHASQVTQHARTIAHA